MGDFNDGIEKAAKWHEEQARSCRSIAAVNADNELGPDSATHAIDHDIAAEEIRALKRPTPDRSEARERIDENAEFEKAWAKRPWTSTRTDKERAFYWWSARAILANGLVQDEASIRADEREKCAQ